MILLFTITEENNKFEHSTDVSDDEFSFAELKDKVAEVLVVSDTSPKELKHKIHGPDNNKTYRKLSIVKRRTVGYFILVLDYLHSPFRNIESYLGISTGLNENNCQKLLKQFNSKFITT